MMEGGGGGGEKKKTNVPLLIHVPLLILFDQFLTIPHPKTTTAAAATTTTQQNKQQRGRERVGVVCDVCVGSRQGKELGGY